MKYFASDFHFGDPRIENSEKYQNVFMRPFLTQYSQNYKIMSELISNIDHEDELYVIGDVLYDVDYKHVLNNLPKCKRIILIKGNYDDDKLDVLSEFFHEIHDELTIQINGMDFYLNHYPTKVREYLKHKPGVFGITGHIHGLWKIKPNMVNVSTDAWHFKPVSEKEILFIKNAAEKYYDENVFF